MCGDAEKLIKKQSSSSTSTLYFVHVEEMFDIIKRIHIATGHGGRDKMLKVIVQKYANITSQAVELYKSLCVECMKKRKRVTTKGVVVKPILTSEYGSRGQVDLIDMQSMPSAQFKWIMVYQDHLTKFCILRPLSSKRAAEVAHQLMDIFLLMGAPHILQSDNGAEFTASVINELKTLWPDLLIVHGKPRHPQSQGSVERLNCDVKDMLIAWLGDNNTADWPAGLRFVQFSKNSSHHTGIKQSPYQALFGTAPRVGLRSTNLPEEILRIMVTEEDLFNAFQTLPSQSADAEVSTPLPSSDTVVTMSSQSADPVARPSSPSADPVVTTSSPSANPVATTSSQPDDPAATTSSLQSADPVATTSSSQTTDLAATTTSSQSINSDPCSIQSCRKRAREGLQQQAQRMLKRSRIDHKAGDPGDNVTVPVPLVDRGRGDTRNIMGVIVDRNENDMYCIAVKTGIL